jgi:hypothetical protein
MLRSQRMRRWKWGRYFGQRREENQNQNLSQKGRGGLLMKPRAIVYEDAKAVEAGMVQAVGLPIYHPKISKVYFRFLRAFLLTGHSQSLVLPLLHQYAYPHSSARDNNRNDHLSSA